jgi:hypothetical protein
MNRFSVFYKSLVSLLTNVVDSKATVPFYNGLNDDDKDRFASLSDTLQANLIELLKKRRRGEVFENFGSSTEENTLSYNIEAFNDEFPNFPNLRMDQIRKVLIFCKHVAPFVNNLRLNPANFTLLPISTNTKPSNYLFYGTTINNSAFIFSLKENLSVDKNRFQKFVDDIPSSQVSILFYALSKLGSKTQLQSEQYILVNKKFAKDPLKVLSLFKLSSVCDGDTIHNPYEVTRIPQVLDRTQLTLENSYSQFLDSINILSEYNYEKDILNKYLRLYHVIENFMYKVPIVEMMTLSGGEMFSIRHFKTLYSKVDKTETAALDDFIKAIFAIHKLPLVTFKQSVQAAWLSLPGLAGFDEIGINSFLDILKIPYQNATAATAGNILTFYCKLIYQVRNSIVHNKETEYHILHSTLNPVVPFLLQNFLFPSLEEICFKLIIETNTKVKYTQPFLKLYHEK